MTKKKYRRKQQKLHPLMPVGIGLFLIGFAFLQ